MVGTPGDQTAVNFGLGLSAASLLVAVVGVMCVALLQTPIDIEATEAAAAQAGALDDVFRRAAVFSHFHAGLAWFGDEGILSPEGLA